MKILHIAALLIAFAASADDVQPTGAKEMFFDPQRSVAEASSAPRKQLDDDGRRVAQVSADTSTRRSLGLSYWIELIETGGKRGVQVTDDRTFQSGERIRLHFRGNSDGRIVLVQIGSSGTSSVLFPDAPKGLAENRVRANQDHVLPSAGHWFRFDNNAGTEKLLVLFAKNQAELDRTFPARPIMNEAETAALLRAVQQSGGSKDLLIETETAEPAEVGTYAVNVTGKPIAVQIALKHR